MAGAIAGRGGTAKKSVEMRIQDPNEPTDDEAQGHKTAPSVGEDDMPDVRVMRETVCSWAVSLDGAIVAHYAIATEALAYASMLECDPRERDLARSL